MHLVHMIFVHTLLITCTPHCTLIQREIRNYYDYMYEWRVYRALKCLVKLLSHMGRKYGEGYVLFWLARRPITLSIFVWQFDWFF